MPRCFARGRRTWPGRCRRQIVWGDGLTAKPVALGANKTNGKRLERGDVRKAVEVALREWPNKSQQEIAEQVGCNVAYVNRIKQELFTSKKLTLPATRTGKDGKSYPTTYATRTTRTATSATFNPERPSTCARVRAMQPDSTLAGNTDRPPSGESSVAGCPTGRRINRAAMWPSSGLATWPSSSPSSSSTGTSMDQDRRRGRCSGVRRGS